MLSDTFTPEQHLRILGRAEAADEVSEMRRKAALLDELRELSFRHQMNSVFLDVLWDVTDEKPDGDVYVWPEH